MGWVLDNERYQSIHIISLQNVRSIEKSILLFDQLNPKYVNHLTFDLSAKGNKWCLSTRRVNFMAPGAVDFRGLLFSFIGYLHHPTVLYFITLRVLFLGLLIQLHCNLIILLLIYVFMYVCSRVYLIWHIMWISSHSFSYEMKLEALQFQCALLVSEKWCQSTTSGWLANNYKLTISQQAWGGCIGGRFKLLGFLLYPYIWK